VLLLVLIFVLVAFGLLLVALVTGTAAFAWISVVVSVAAAVALVYDWAQRRAAVKTAVSERAPRGQFSAPTNLVEPPTTAIPVLGNRVLDPATEVFPAIRPNSGARPSGADVAGTVAIPPVSTPSGSPDRPSSAEPDGGRSGDRQSPSVMPVGAGRTNVPNSGKSSPSGDNAEEKAAAESGKPREGAGEVAAGVPESASASGSPAGIPALPMAGRPRDGETGRTRDGEPSEARPSDAGRGSVPGGVGARGADAAGKLFGGSREPAGETAAEEIPAKDTPARETSARETEGSVAQAGDTPARETQAGEPGKPDAKPEGAVSGRAAGVTGAAGVAGAAGAAGVAAAAAAAAGREQQRPPSESDGPSRDDDERHTAVIPAATDDAEGQNTGRPAQQAAEATPATPPSSPPSAPPAAEDDGPPTQTIPPVPPAPAPEPDEEQASPAAAAIVATLSDEVVVIDEQPRFHLASCRLLPGTETIPLPVKEAVEYGFTPCRMCSPVRTLAARNRAASSS